MNGRRHGVLSDRGLAHGTFRYRLAHCRPSGDAGDPHRRARGGADRPRTRPDGAAGAPVGRARGWPGDLDWAGLVAVRRRSAVAVARPPALGAFRQEIEKVPERAVIVMRLEPRGGNAADRLALTPEGRYARQAAAFFVDEAHIRREGRACMADYRKAPTAIGRKRRLLLRQVRARKR